MACLQWALGRVRQQGWIRVIGDSEIRSITAKTSDDQKSSRKGLHSTEQDGLSRKQLRCAGEYVGSGKEPGRDTGSQK